ncbi:MAG: hypothetical protein JNK63_08585 [Chthonomonas sp.]|nr:hypothetical protein [Chthonomonas sp.]
MRLLGAKVFNGKITVPSGKVLQIVGIRGEIVVDTRREAKFDDVFITSGDVIGTVTVMPWASVVQISMT